MGGREPMSTRDSNRSKQGIDYDLPESWPKAQDEDVGSPAAVVTALYEVISGPADQDREWDRFRSLCLPSAQFLITRWPAPDDEREGLWEWDVEGFVAEAAPFYEQGGFWEKEVGARAERFGNVAHIFSTYESRIGSEDSAPVGRGINSFQLVRFKGRWWIANVCWDVERPHNVIPDRYANVG